MIYKLITFKLSFRTIFRLFFLFYGLKLRSKCESQKGENLLVLYISNFLFTKYLDWNLALAMSRAWVGYGLI